MIEIDIFLSPSNDPSIRVSATSFSMPVTVSVFPEAVCPYANMVPMPPPHAHGTSGFTNES
jgi:hypothetical protein